MARRIDDPERALVLARTIASDIALYNEEKLASGGGGATPRELLEQEIKEGRQYFEQRVAPEVPADELYERAIAEILSPKVT